MANHKSAQKRMRQTARKTEQRSRTRSTVRTFEKKLRKAIESKNSSEAQTLFMSFQSQLSKAAQKGIYHAKTAARKVGRLAKQIQQLG